MTSIEIYTRKIRQIVLESNYLPCHQLHLHCSHASVSICQSPWRRTNAPKKQRRRRVGTHNDWKDNSPPIMV